jgi:hypothetical protein
MRGALLLFACGCGRIGFATGSEAIDASDAPRADAGAPGDDGPRDANAACQANPAYVAVGGLAHTYRQPAALITWDEARLDCANDGAFLAVMNDAMEAAALDGDWIGLTDVEVEGVWLTVNGEPAPYLAWVAGEPDGGTAENCARNDTLGFEARACTDLRDYVCECE